MDDRPVTREWLLSLPGVELADTVDLYSLLVFDNEFLQLQFEVLDGGVCCWAVTGGGLRELRCEITRANVLALLAAFGPPVEGSTE